MVILAADCLAQIVLAMRWLARSNALRTWAKSLQDIEKKVSGIRSYAAHVNVLRQNVVSWKGRPHLKEASAYWLTKSQIEEEHGGSIWVLYGLCAAVFLTTVSEFIATHTAESWVAPAMLSLVCGSLGLTLFINQRLTSSIREARLALDAACPPLPSADNVTRDVMERAEADDTVAKGQQQSLDSLGKSQATLAKLGTNLQLAFQKCSRASRLQAWQNSKLLSDSQQANQRYVEETTRKQNQVVQGLIVQVMDGIDQAIGKSLRDTSESFAASVQRQQVSADRWRRSVESVAEVIGTPEQTTKGGHWCRTYGAGCGASTAAAQVFSDSAKELQKIFQLFLS